MDEALKQTLMDAGVKFVRILWCDNANVIRAKAAYIDRLEDFIDNGVGITVAQMALPVMHDAVVPETGLGPVGEVRLMPDWSTLTITPYADRNAQVLSDMVMCEENVVWEHCPRGFMKRQAKKLEEKGITLQGVFENEFFLLEKSDDAVLKPADDTIFAATGAMNLHCAFINDLADALVAQGLEVESYYAESGPGQQEMNIRYADALRAADRQILYRETVRGVAARHGIVASFFPKIVENAAGSGCHINFSLWSGGENVSGAPGGPAGLGPEACAFIAGILEHLPALCALTIPSKSSYRRIRPHFWAGAFRAWGCQNREAAVRVCKNKTGERASRIEYKTADATANPYIALGSLIAAGLDGLERNLELPEEVDVDPGLIPEDERNEKGIDLLPQTLEEALEALRKDDVLLAALGEPLARSYMAVRRNEWEHMKDMSLEEEAAILVERY